MSGSWKLASTVLSLTSLTPSIMATDNKKALVYSIMEFLDKSCKDGSVKEDSVEGIEGKRDVSTLFANAPFHINHSIRYWLLTYYLSVAIQCLGDAFDVDPTDPEQQKQFSTKPATLQNIFDVYLKTKSSKKVSTHARFPWSAFLRSIAKQSKPTLFIAHRLLLQPPQLLQLRLLLNVSTMWVLYTKEKSGVGLTCKTFTRLWLFML